MTLNSIIANFQTFKLADLLDIIIIAFLIYQLLGIINRTRAGQLAKGALLVLAVYLVANVLNMRTVTWLLNSLLQVGLLTLVVLFQPEITVHADEKLLSQVLINLLKNAMQALEGQADGKIRMEVDTEKNQLLIRVTDNGPGVPSDLIEDIFVPFFTTKTTGSGIGLSLSRQIIRMHGGELSVASQPYRETCFTVSLPVMP